MSKHIESGLNNVKTKFAIVVLVVAPIIFVAGHVQAVFAASSDDSPKVCVIATLNSNPSVLASFGPCPKATATADPIVSSTSPATTSAPSPTDAGAISGSQTESPAPAATTDDPYSHTESPSPAPTPTATATATATAEAPHTHTEPPTSAPTTEEPHTESPSPTPTTTTQPDSQVYDIPPENKDPNTKEFRFCHHGEPHSNSYTGMIAGHHDKHAEDIIPPIPFKFYKGWNWTEENAKTFYNNCVPVK